MHLTLGGLARQTSVYGIFQLLQKAVGLAVIPLYTHYLSPDQMGSLDILYLIVWMIGTVGGSKLDAAFVRFYPEAVRSGNLRQLLSSSVAGLVIVATGFCLIGALAATPILEFMFSGKEAPLVGFYLALLATWLELVGSLPLAYLRTQHEARLVGTISLAQSLAGTCAGFYLVVFQRIGFLGLVIGLVVSGVTLVALAYAAMLRRAPLGLDFHYCRRLFAYALPMLPAPFFMYLLNYENRYFLLRFGSLEDVGIYSMAYKFAMLAFLFVVSPFSEMWGPNQFLLHEEGRKDTYERITLLYVSVLFLVALGVIYFSHEATVLFIAPAYHPLLPLVAPLCVAVALWGVVPTLDLGFQVRNRTWIRSLTTGITAAANAGLNWLLIPALGTMGAALATLGSFVLLVLLTHAFNAALTDYSIPLRKASVLTLLLGAAALLPLAAPQLPYLAYLLLRVLALLAFIGICLRVNELRLAGILPALRTALGRGKV